jgi:hypothetical protein
MWTLPSVAAFTEYATAVYLVLAGTYYVLMIRRLLREEAAAPRQKQQ